MTCRKNKPDRSRRRNEHIRQSLTIPQLRRTRHQYDSEEGSDIEIYQSIRNSAIRSTLVPSSVPTLPRRPSPLGGSLGAGQDYDYADPDRLLRPAAGLRTADRLLADGKDSTEDFTYGGDPDETNKKIQNDVDIYVGDMKKGGNTGPAVYAVVNKRKTVDDHETLVVDNATYVPLEEQQQVD